MDQWDLVSERAPYMLHVLTKVWEALQRFLKEVQKGAPTEGATAIKASPRCPSDPPGQIAYPLHIYMQHATHLRKERLGTRPHFVAHL